MHQHKRLLPVIAAAWLLGSGSAALGQPLHRMGPPGAPPRAGSGPQRNPEQQAAAQKIYQEHADRIATLRQALQDKHRALNDLLNSTNPDAKASTALVKDIAKLDEEWLQEHVAIHRQLAQAGIPASAVGPCPGCQGAGMMGEGCQRMGTGGAGPPAGDAPPPR